MQVTLRRPLLLLSLLMLPLLGIELATQLSFRRERQAEIHAEAMRLLDGVEAEQLRLNDDVRHILGTLATVAAPQLEGSGCQAALEGLRDRLPAYLMVEVTGPNGRIRCATDTRTVGAVITDRDNVQRAIATNGFALGAYSVVRPLGHAVLTFAEPFRQADGAPAGAITAVLDIAWLGEFLQRRPLPEGAVVLITDRSGTVLARTPPLSDQVGQPLPDRLRFMLTGHRRTTLDVRGTDGVKRVTAYSSTDIGAEGIMIMAAIDKAAAMRPIDASLWHIMAVFTGVLAICYMGTAWGVRRLVHLRKRLILALKAGRAGTFDLDLRTGTAVWSEETFRIFGLEPRRGKVGHGAWTAALHPEDRDRVLRERQAAIDAHAREHHIEYRVVHRDGSVRWVETVVGVDDAKNGAPLRLYGLHIDITRRKHTEDALRAAKEEAERANRSKSKFLAAASHDLRQPLQSMFLFASALRPHVTSERGRHALTMLERGLDALKGLLESLLDVSRLDAGALCPTIEDVALRPLLDHIGASYLPVAAAKGLELQVRNGREIVVRSDRNLLGRMIRNLLENAIRYTEQGVVRLECHVLDGRARIEVHDTGIGIPAEQLDRIFDEFHQVGNPERDRSQGLGLGLSIVQRLSTLLDHPVTVWSKPGRGSVFTVSMPLGTAQEPAPAPENVAVAPNGAGRLALLIDDDADVLFGLQAIFRDWGYRTYIAASAEQAIEQLRAAGGAPDVIIADHRLRSGERGPEAVRRLRAFLGAPVPAIVLSGETGSAWQQEAADLGCAIAFKPVTPRQLQDVLQRHAGHGAGPPTPFPASDRPG